MNNTDSQELVTKLPELAVSETAITPADLTPAPQDAPFVETSAIATGPIAIKNIGSVKRVTRYPDPGPHPAKTAFEHVGNLQSEELPPHAGHSKTFDTILAPLSAFAAGAVTMGFVMLMVQEVF